MTVKLTNVGNYQQIFSTRKAILVKVFALVGTGGGNRWDSNSQQVAHGISQTGIAILVVSIKAGSSLLLL